MHKITFFPNQAGYKKILRKYQIEFFNVQSDNNIKLRKNIAIQDFHHKYQSNNHLGRHLNYYLKYN